MHGVSRAGRSLAPKEGRSGRGGVAMPVRRILLIRHGQYDESGEGWLTPLGRKQAEATGRALRDLELSGIVSSTLPRARETADILAESFPGLRVTRSSLLCECIPTALPAALKLRLDPQQIKDDRERAERAFAKVFRPTKTPKTELVVCHGNIIRYFACRVMGVQARAWVKMQSLHCGITEVTVLSTGETRLASYNDTGHLPRKLRTMSNAATKRD